MQETNGITFEPIVRKAVIEPWEIIAAILLFACLIGFAVWRSRKRFGENAGSLHLDGK
jgi:hypothetical protein